jgi:Ser/Thr protein kinase RdoA (MazF antagonist)
MDTGVIAKVLDKYGVSYVSVGDAQKGYRNSSYKITQADGNLANLILYKKEADILGRIRQANRTSDFLAAQGLPARRTLGGILKLQSGDLVRYCALYSYLPGETIPWEGYTMDHLKALGMTMSTMHHVLEGLPAGRTPKVTDEYRSILARMAHYFADMDVMAAMRTKLGITITPVFAHFGELLAVCDQLHGQQQLHMDFVRGNILFAPANGSALEVGNVRVSGILDLEKAGRGHPILDIARTLAFLLVDCKYKTGPQIRKYFLHSGYSKRGRTPVPLRGFVRPGAEQEILEELVSLFLFYDFYKFLRHNPYESLHENEHFVRTKEILLKRKIVARIE